MNYSGAISDTGNLIAQSGSVLNTIKGGWDIISFIESNWSTILFIGGIGFIIWLILYFLIFQGSRNYRILRNLSRRVYLVSSLNGARLQTEKSIIESNYLFKTHNTVIDIQSNPNFFARVKNSALVIEYDENYQKYQDIIRQAEANNLVLVIYSTNPTAITPAHRSLFQTYPYFEMCNSIGRILSSLYNLLVITPYEKR